MRIDLPLLGDWKVCCFRVLIGFSCLQGAISQPGLSQPVQALKQFQVPEAKQGVAVDADFFYVINDHSITKHQKSDGKQVAAWQDQEGQLQHLNSGVVIKGKLYCAHSNYPESPMASSIEIFETATLKHIGNHSLGILAGSATWVDFWNDSWWVGFAHYSGKGASEGKDNRWTVVVKFDKAWRQTESWLFPQPLLEKFAPKSNSGAAGGPITCYTVRGTTKPNSTYSNCPTRALRSSTWVRSGLHFQGKALPWTGLGSKRKYTGSTGLRTRWLSPQSSKIAAWQHTQPVYKVRNIEKLIKDGIRFATVGLDHLLIASDLTGIGLPALKK
jgi:hypothetical protein